MCRRKHAHIARFVCKARLVQAQQTHLTACWAAAAAAPSARRARITGQRSGPSSRTSSRTSPWKRWWGIGGAAGPTSPRRAPRRRRGPKSPPRAKPPATAAGRMKEGISHWPPFTEHPHAVPWGVLLLSSTHHCTFPGNFGVYTPFEDEGGSPTPLVPRFLSWHNPHVSTARAPCL